MDPQEKTLEERNEGIPAISEISTEEKEEVTVDLGRLRAAVLDDAIKDLSFQGEYVSENPSNTRIDLSPNRNIRVGKNHSLHLFTYKRGVLTEIATPDSLTDGLESGSIPIGVINNELYEETRVNDNYPEGEDVIKIDKEKGTITVTHIKREATFDN